jgi:hypothetical protein
MTVGQWEAQAVIDEGDKDKELKYKRKVNFNQAVGTFKDRFIKALLEPDPMTRAESAVDIVRRMAASVIPIRPGRSRPRNPNPRKSNFCHNQKSNY